MLFFMILFFDAVIFSKEEAIVQLDLDIKIAG